MIIQAENKIKHRARQIRRRLSFLIAKSLKVMNEMQVRELLHKEGKTLYPDYETEITNPYEKKMLSVEYLRQVIVYLYSSSPLNQLIPAMIFTRC